MTAGSPRASHPAAARYADRNRPRGGAAAHHAPTTPLPRTTAASAEAARRTYARIIARYALARSFVEGSGAARNDDVLGGFQQWLSSQPQHRAISNFVWSSLLLHEMFPERDRVIRPPGQNDPATADSNWSLQRLAAGSRRSSP